MLLFDMRHSIYPFIYDHSNYPKLPPPQGPKSLHQKKKKVQSLTGEKLDDSWLSNRNIVFFQRIYSGMNGQKEKRSRSPGECRSLALK